MTVKVLPYNPQWKAEFLKLSSFLKDNISLDYVDIQHVGSTSVEGLWAKPIIDLDIIVENEKDKKLVIDNLRKIGYNHIGDLGIKGREAFKLSSGNSPDFLKKLQFEHHLYLCIKGITSLENHLLFRDYLREHPEACIRYSNLKKELAKRFPENFDTYTEAKTDFIVDILIKTGITDSDINDIAKQNKIKQIREV